MVEKQYRVGITFGAFDPLHYGHVKLLERAKKQCEKLIVLVSSDEYIYAKKEREPRISMPDRIKAIQSLVHVDEVTIQCLDDFFGGYVSFTKKNAIEHFKPDVIFVGDDWTPETFTGEGLGVPVVYLPYTKGISSTLLVQDSNDEKGE